ncbi:MAG: GNAT family N-acetyltransferase, partial [Rhodobacterales bacterium]|nr:GNAT family N-acetyltransferase [Rhodobacterales bacterium]
RTADRLAAIRRLARWPGITVVTLAEEITGRGLIPLVTPMHHAVWTLGPDLRRGMARNWRGHLSRAERSGLPVRQAGLATLDALIAVEARQRSERRYRALPEGFSRALPEGDLRLWEWREGGELQAAMAFVRHGTSASYHLSWGSAAAREAGAHALMLTLAAGSLWAEGVRWLDLGSVDSERAPGLALFKLGTGASLRRLGSTMLVLP